MLLARAEPRRSKSKKTPDRLLKNSRLSVFSGCLGTDRGRDKLARWSGIKSGLFFRPNTSTTTPTCSRRPASTPPPPTGPGPTSRRQPRSCDSRGCGTWGDYQPVSLAPSSTRRWAQSGGQAPHWRTAPTVAFDSPEGVEAAPWLIGKSGTDHAHRRGRCRHARLRHQPLQGGQAGDVALGHLDVRRARRGAIRLGHRGRAGQHHPGERDVRQRRRRLLEDRGGPQRPLRPFAESHLAGSTTSAETRVATGWELPPNHAGTSPLRTDYLAKTRRRPRQVRLRRTGSPW